VLVDRIGECVNISTILTRSACKWCHGSSIEATGCSLGGAATRAAAAAAAVIVSDVTTDRTVRSVLGL